MVEIIVYKNRADEVVSFQVHGHAGYADQGQDIVCSAVSVLTLNTVNSISHLLGIKLEPTSDLGILECHFPKQQDLLQQEKMQLLLQSMVLGIQAIKDNYSEYIEYKTKHV
ncbi:ribosomal-processing cysteine protease Prp [Desulfuribacillus alkaliarsenatis]|uniref:Ribosomal processing cysteine protease Prp n=1 Tax=Desulfuribacillus alkaliarsenatis TaxID=766136 RepID=A0A1E5G5B4_9FIRM|nr:ribosomal-processing cysteine protease Prp [Desulfuribacillus alkaliarsenatis]OEF98358.1 hypothetical protein BHF68_01370 [Desulfuribacillus alkaliarsenatis]